MRPMHDEAEEEAKKTVDQLCNMGLETNVQIYFMIRLNSLKL